MTDNHDNKLLPTPEGANEQLKELLSLANDNQEKIDRIQTAELQLLQSESLPELFDYLFDAHTQLFQLLAVKLLLIDEDQRIKRILEETGEINQFSNNLTLINDNQTVARLLKIGSHPVLSIYNDDEHAWLVHETDGAIQSLAILPLIRHHRVIGVAVCTSDEINRFQPDLGTDLLNRLSAILAISIENSVNHHHLQYLGLTDALTGARNRRFLDQRLQESVAAAMHTGKPLSFLFIDIDFFKKINDNHGHQTGDRVLTEVADIIYSQLRNVDVLARYGGEEFALLLKDLYLDAAVQIAERIRAAIETTRITVNDETIPVTVSIGVAELSRISTPEQNKTDLAYRLTQAADSALYEAKESGRNRVIAAD